MKRENLLIAVALAGVVAGGAHHEAHAQSATAGAIQGVVSDKATGQVMVGVTAVATSPALQGTQSAISDASGFYKFTNLPPGLYVVTFYYASVTHKRTDIEVNANRTTPVYAKIDTAQAAGEVIEIRGTPNIDTTSTTQGVTLDRNYTRNIPVPGRTYEDALGAAAGSAGDALGVSFSGSTSLENQYIVDGVNTTGLTFGTVGSPIINEFISEIEIITGGYQAEYGRATGGLVNVVTKQGSNEFHGSVFTTVTSDYLAKDPTRNPTEATSIDVTRTQNYNANIGFEVGGPIVKDKLWFFVGFSPTFVDTKLDRVTKRRTDCRTVQANGRLSECNPELYGDGLPDEDLNGFLIYEDIAGGATTLDQATQSYQLVSKINYALAPEHQGHVALSGLATNAEILNPFGELAAASFDQHALTSDLSVKWTSKFNQNKTEIESVLGWHRETFTSDSIDDSVNDLPRQNLLFGTLDVWGRRGYESMATVSACSDSAAAGDPYPLVENCPDEGVGYRIGGPGAIADDLEQRFTATLAGTQRLKVLGTHEIKLGGNVEQNLLSKPRSFSGDAFYEVWIGNSESVQEEENRVFPSNRTDITRWVEVAPRTDESDNYAELCGDDPNSEDQLRCRFLGPTDVDGNTFNWAAYLRDSWQILPNLTLNAGVRYEEQYLRYAEHLQGTPDPFTLEPRGKNAMEMTGMWAPRVGLLYDWTREGRSKVYGSYGRYFESIPMDINDRSFGGETQATQEIEHTECGEDDPSIGAPPGPACDGGDVTRTRLFGGSGVLVAPGIKPQYMDEYIVGAEYEVIEDLKVGLSLQRRTLGRVIEDVSTDGAFTYILANPGEFSSENVREVEAEIADLMATGDPNDFARAERKAEQLEQYKGIRIFDKPTRNYSALQMTAVKRFSRNFFMQGSYTYSRTTGNFPGLFSADNGQVDPNITSQYDLIELLGNRFGPLPQDRPHYFKLDGYYTFDFEKLGALTTGGRFRALSGVATEALARHFKYGVDESFLLPRGEMGRVDPDWTLDAHLGYARDLPRGMKLEVFTDFFGLPTLVKKEGVVSVDETYTLNAANPVVGGDYEDLIWVKAQTVDGNESSAPLQRNRNFRNPAGRYNTFFTQIGARLIF